MPVPIETVRNPLAISCQPILGGRKEPFSIEDAASITGFMVTSIEQFSKKARSIRETLTDLPTRMNQLEVVSLNAIFKTTIGSARFTESIHIPKRRRFRRKRRCRCRGRKIGFSNSVHSPECGGVIG